MSDVARACVSITALSAFPMQHFPARLALHSWWVAIRGASLPASKRRADRWEAMARDRLDGHAAEAATDGLVRLSTSFIVVEGALWTALSALLAYLVGSRIDKVFGFIGAVCGGAVIFLFPGLLWLRLGEGSAGSLRRILPAALMLLLGAFIMIIGTYENVEKLVAVSPAPNCTGPGAGNASSFVQRAPYPTTPWLG